MDQIKKCIEACNDCASECENCATECLFEEHSKKLTKCILLTRECSVICAATAKILSIGADNFQMLCRACEDLCDMCADECGKHADMQHCKKCFEACRSAAEACKKIIVEDSL